MKPIEEKLKSKRTTKYITELGALVTVEKKHCHLCKKKFESYGKYNILCKYCKNKDVDEYNLYI